MSFLPQCPCPLRLLRERVIGRKRAVATDGLLRNVSPCNGGETSIGACYIKPNNGWPSQAADYGRERPVKKCSQGQRFPFPRPRKWGFSTRRSGFHWTVHLLPASFLVYCDHRLLVHTRTNTIPAVYLIV
ncbi:hypothetical protein J6590_024502 [Homalodisca vitripennis]|nr:hypothetical protein J6590_024502 [Homalodisca vitripennis]